MQYDRAATPRPGLPHRGACRALSLSHGGRGRPNTKACRREVEKLTGAGLEQDLRVLKAGGAAAGHPPSSVAYVSSIFDEKAGQSVLRLHLNNGRTVAVFEPDAPDMLAQLGLDEFGEDWTLNLVRYIG